MDIDDFQLKVWGKVLRMWRKKRISESIFDGKRFEKSQLCEKKKMIFEGLINRGERERGD